MMGLDDISVNPSNKSYVEFLRQKGESDMRECWRRKSSSL